MTTNKALVRRPGPRLAEGIVTHVERVAVDDRLALRQWEGYCEAMESARWELLEVSPADDCPDAVFVEDAVVVCGNLAVITRPGAETRRPELAEVERVVKSLGYTIDHIQPPGTLDGGDVLKVGDTVYVGRGDRTNEDGIRQLRAILAPHGKTVAAVPLRSVLHLKSAVTALPDGTILGYPRHVDNSEHFPRFLAVPEASGAHVVILDNKKLLIGAGCPQTAELISDLGYEPVIVDISEFEKLEGGVTCLSVRLRRTTGAAGQRLLRTSTFRPRTPAALGSSRWPRSASAESAQVAARCRGHEGMGIWAPWCPSTPTA
jgi:dimethylargininase